MSSDAKETFLLNMIFSNTLSSALQHSPTYIDGTVENVKDGFHDELKMSLQVLSEQYCAPVTEAVHCQNIEALSDLLSKKHARILRDGRFRIGSSQKSLNLYLKYLWCLNRIEMPPHCPVDAVVIAKLDTCKNDKWTQLDDIEEYKAIIREARGKAERESLSLAEWELQLYNTATDL